MILLQERICSLTEQILSCKSTIRNQKKEVERIVPDIPFFYIFQTTYWVSDFFLLTLSRTEDLAHLLFVY